MKEYLYKKDKTLKNVNAERLKEHSEEMFDLLWQIGTKLRISEMKEVDLLGFFMALLDENIIEFNIDDDEENE